PDPGEAAGPASPRVVPPGGDLEGDGHPAGAGARGVRARACGNGAVGDVGARVLADAGSCARDRIRRLARADDAVVLVRCGREPGDPVRLRVRGRALPGDRVPARGEIGRAHV